MGKQGSTSGKRQREAEKAAKAKAKRDRRLQPRAESEHTEPEVGRPMAPEDVLALVAEVHRRFESAEISFDEYEETKTALLRQLQVD